MVTLACREGFQADDQRFACDVGCRVHTISSLSYHRMTVLQVRVRVCVCVCVCVCVMCFITPHRLAHMFL